MQFVTRDGKKMNGIHGYKGLSMDNTSILGKHFQFEQGKIFKEKLQPQFKARGFHFCLHLEDVIKFVPNCSKIVEVYALGDIEGNGRFRIDISNPEVSHQFKIIQPTSSL